MSVALGLCAVGLLIPAASAQTSPTSPSTTVSTTPAPVTPPTGANPASNTWALSPTAPEGATSGARDAFTYAMTPGASLRDSATVWNYSDAERTFDVYARDAFTTDSGGFDVRRIEEPSSGVGSWIRLDDTRVTVPARSGRPIGFTLTIPGDATPGDHAGGMVASLVTVDTDVAERSVRVDHRVGSRIYIRIAGTLAPALVVEQIDTAYRGSPNPLGRGEADVTYTIRNVGNVRQRAHQSVSVHGVFGLATQRHDADDLGEVLPGAAISRTEHFVDVPPLVRLTGEVTVDPFPVSSEAGGAVAEFTARGASTWSVPWAFLAGMVLAGALVGLVRRRSRSVPESPGGASGEQTTVAGQSAPHGS